MAYMDLPEHGDENLSEEQKVLRIKQQRLSWEQREKNYLAQMSLMEQANYRSYKHQIAGINQQQLLIIHEELYLFCKRQQSVIKTLAMEAAKNM